VKVVESVRDMLLFEVDSGSHHLEVTIADISEDEYSWESIPPSERSSDLLLPPEQKRVWRVFQKDGLWVYDYALGQLDPPPFTTIAWIMNHIAQTADMYLYCIKSGQPEGVERSWDDLPVSSHFEAMKIYTFEVLADVREYLLSIPATHVSQELNKLTPAPWGEMRPTYLNIWGGVVEHVIQHAMQIAVRKENIRYGY
jgi:hypothetical protein